MIPLVLYLGSILFVCFALLALKRFDNTLLWKLTIPATEAGHWIAFSAGIFSVGCLLYGPSGIMPAIIALGAGWILLRPIRKAREIATTLPGRLRRAFGPAAPGVSVFSIARLFLPVFQNTGPEHTEAETRDGRRLRIDLFRTRETGARPLVVVIHGGGWNNGDTEQLPDLNHILRRSGYTVASISYGLVPDHRWPRQRSDVIACIEHLRRNADDLSIDPDRIILLGRSAGGQLATHVSYTSRIAGLRGVVSLYGPQDLEFAYQNAQPDDLIHSRRLLEEYLDGSYDVHPERYREASPYFAVHKKLPPTLLIHGKHDLLTWYLQSLRLHRVLDRAGVTNMYLEFSWATHAFDFFLHGPAGQLTTYAILWFLETCTHSDSTQ